MGVTQRGCYIGVTKSRVARFFVLCLFWGGVAQADVDRSGDPGFVIKAVLEQSIERLLEQRSSIRDDFSVARDIVDQELMSLVNTRYMISQYAKATSISLTSQEKSDIAKGLRDYQANLYSHLLIEHLGSKVVYKPSAEDYANKRRVSVSVELLNASNESTPLYFELGKSRRSKEWAVLKIVWGQYNTSKVEENALHCAYTEGGQALFSELLQTSANSEWTFIEIRRAITDAQIECQERPSDPDAFNPFEDNELKEKQQRERFDKMLEAYFND